MAKQKIPHHYHAIILTLILLVGFLLRAVEFLNHNYLFGFDQGRDYLLVAEMVSTRKPRLIGAEVGAGSAGISGLFHGPVYLYLLTLFYFLFSGDPYGGIVMMFLFGMAALIASYFVSKRIFGPWGALLTTFFVSISPNIAPQSRFLWNHHPTTFFIVIALYCTYMIPKKPSLFLPLALAVAGFIYNFELAIAVPMVMSIAIYSFLVLKIRNVRVWAMAILGLFVVFLPFVFFEIKHNFLGIGGLISYLLNGNKSSTMAIEKLLSDHIRDYWNNAAFTFPFEIAANNLMLRVIFFVVILCSVILSLREETNAHVKKIIWYLLISIAFSWGFFILLQNNIWDYYLIHLHIAYILLATYGILYILRKKIYAFGVIISICLLIMLGSCIKRVYQDYSYDYSDFGGGAKIAGKLQSIDYIYKDAQQDKFNVFVFMPPIYTYPYDYLFSWYGQRKYGYVPGSEKKGLFYLLIEPDGAKPWSHKGWMETVIKSGTVVWTKELSSGLIVEKRYEDIK